MSASWADVRKRPAPIPSGARATVTWHIEQSQEDHQQAFPEGVVSRDGYDKVSAQRRLVATVFLVHHLDPRLVAPTDLTTTPQHEPIRCQVRNRLPLHLVQRPAQIPQENQPLALPQQPLTITPERMTAQVGTSSGKQVP